MGFVWLLCSSQIIQALALLSDLTYSRISYCISDCDVSTKLTSQKDFFSSLEMKKCEEERMLHSLSFLGLP